MQCPTCNRMIYWKMKRGQKIDVKCPCGFSYKGYKKEIDANTLLGNWNCNEIDKLDKKMRHFTDHNFTFFKGRKIYSFWQNNASHDLSKLKIARNLQSLLKRI